MDRTLSHRLFRIAASTVVLAGMLAAPTIAGRDFEGVRRTTGPRPCSHSSSETVIPKTGHNPWICACRGRMAGWHSGSHEPDMDREGRFAAGATAPTGEACAETQPQCQHSGGFTDRGIRKPGLGGGGGGSVPRWLRAAVLVTGGVSPHIIDAYAAVVQFDSARTTAGAFIVRLHGDIISDASTEILTTPVNLDAACATNCRVVFTVIGSSLSMKVYSVYVHPGTGEVTTSLVTDVTATDTALGAGLERLRSLCARERAPSTLMMCVCSGASHPCHLTPRHREP